MKKLVVLCLQLCFVVPCFAETRGKPFAPEKLYEMSVLVFEGTVTKIITAKRYKKTFPTSAKVTKVLKGKTDKKELPLKHKSPGKFTIFEEEYNVPEIGQKGTFYIQDMYGTLVLIGFIQKTKPAVMVPLSVVSQISYTDSAGQHAAPVRKAYAKYQGNLISVRGFITVSGIPAALATQPTLGLHRPANPQKDAIIAVSGLEPPERGKPYIAVGRLIRDGEKYSLAVTEWKKLKTTEPKDPPDKK